jgi:hypothetical protein
MLLAEFQEMAALEKWTGTMARLIIAPLSEGGYGLALDREGESALAHIFSDSKVAREHELTVRVVDGTRQAVLRQAAHDS